MPTLPPDFRLPLGFLPPTPGPVAAPKDAASVVLLRDAPDARDADAGVEVFLQRRVAGMAFAGGMTVFPGGGVDGRDAGAVPWAGPPPRWWARRLGCDPPLAQAVVCAAVRETFEETGVLLAGPDADRVVADTAPYHAQRAALAAGTLSLARFLTDAGLVLRADLLRPWANWVTPESEPRRYDTRFLLAVLPAGQRADAVTTEAADADWQAPAAALDDWRQGRRWLLPPTWYILAELAELTPGASSARLLAEAQHRVIEKVMPRLVREADGVRVLLPNDPHGPEAAAAPRPYGHLS